MQTFIKFIENEEHDEADLFIYGDIVDMSWWDDDVSANNIRKQLNETEAKTIHVHINSLGGDTFTGVAIYNLLREKSKTSKIITYVDSIAASAASVIAMAGDKIVMPSNTIMMIHNCWTLSVGNAKELRKVASDMDKIMDAVIQCYLSKINISEDELRTLLDEETYLTAQEALEKGFCDEILELKEDSTGAKQKVLSSLVEIIKKSKEKSKVINETNILVSNKITEKEIEDKSDKPSLFNLK